MIKPFVYVSLKDWCRSVKSVEELEVHPNSYFPAPHRAGFERFGPPDYFDAADERNIVLYGQEEFVSVWPYNVPVYNYCVWNDDVFMARVDDAVFLRDNFFEGRCHVFVREGIAAAETYHSMWMSGVASRMAREQLTVSVTGSEVPVNFYRDIPPATAQPDEAILMTHLMMDNYAHFLNEVVPRFWWLEAMPSLRRYPILMPRYPEGTYQHEVLVPLLDGLQVVEPSAPALRFKRLFVPTFLANGSYSREMAAFTDRTVRRALGLSSDKKRRRRIYVSRSDASQRRVLNEEAVMQGLSALGFECHVTGRMSVRQQVELFSDAEIIVAPHGAAVANIVFAPTGSLLIELLADPYLHPMYWIVSKLKQMRYARLAESAINDQFDINVDIRRLVSVVERFLS